MTMNDGDAPRRTHTRAHLRARPWRARHRLRRPRRRPRRPGRSLASVLTTLATLGGAMACTERQANTPATPPDAQVLPTRYVAGRFVVRPVTVAGDTLSIFTDTGGGLFLRREAVDRLGLTRDSAGTVALPAFREGAGIPAPLGSPGGRLFVLDDRSRGFGDWDGMLGQQWFADRVWMFDYPNQRLLLLASSSEAGGDSTRQVPLGFQTSPSGERTLSFPRIRIEIDGDSLDMLFDTGATVAMPPAALQAIGDGGPPERATSFITSTTMNGWRERHPGWHVIENADQNVSGMAMIEVPAIRVAGHEVGPVWFTQRPDRNFHEYMSGFMDRTVEGALGGSGLRFFRVTVDYPRAVARFER